MNGTTIAHTNEIRFFQFPVMKIAKTETIPAQQAEMSTAKTETIPEQQAEMSTTKTETIPAQQAEMSTTKTERIPARQAENPREENAAQYSRPDEHGPFPLEVDPLQDYKAKELKFFTFARPHMRAFHYAWWTIFITYFSAFAISPLLPEIQISLNLDNKQIWLTYIVGVFGDIICRVKLCSDKNDNEIIVSLPSLP